MKNLEKLFRENKTSPLLKTPEKDFQGMSPVSINPVIDIKPGKII